MKKLILLSCIAIGLISTAAIAEAAGPVGKAVGGTVGAGVGAGVGAAAGALTAPAKGVNSALKCVDKQACLSYVLQQAPLIPLLAPWRAL